MVEQFASVAASTTAGALQEISNRMLSSNQPGQICSASTAGAVKMALWRKKLRISPTPRPRLPRTHEEFMNTTVPDEYSETADGDDLIIFRDWVEEDKTKCMVVCMSSFGADILRTHPVWMMDGTFSSTPPPFAQV